MLPKLSGFEVCRILRKEMTTPILMLTVKDEEVDKLKIEHYHYDVYVIMRI
jgi:DNA-binding response OmpR family regulator